MKMYRLAYQTLKKNIAVFGFYVIFFVAIERFFEINSGTSFVVGAILALYTHRMILLDENYGMADLSKWRGPSGQKPPIFSFFLASGIGLLVFLLIFGAVFYLLFYRILGVNLDDKEQLIGAMLFALIPAAAFYGILLSLIGTVFPAVAIGADRGLKTAYRRGKASFWKTLGRLAVGPFALTLLGLSSLIAITMYLEKTGYDVSSAAVDVPLSLLAYCVNFGSILLAVTALSMAYIEADRTKQNVGET